MIYRYLQPLSWVFNIFGLTKPLLSKDGKPKSINLLLKIWSLLAAIAFLTSYILSCESIQLSLKYHLEQLSDINDLAINVSIILISLVKGDTTCINLYETLNKVLVKIEFGSNILKLLAIKMYLWFGIAGIVFLVLIILEFVYSSPPYVLLVKISTFLSMLHLFMHLYVILAVLKVVNEELSKVLIYDNDTTGHEEITSQRILLYIIRPDIRFIQMKAEANLELKHLCEIYDEISICNQLLQEIHGLQILLSIWLMFSSAVAGVTLIVCDQAKIKWLVIAKTILPFVWTFMGCYIDDQLQHEVDQTNTQIIKCLIDYRCDSSKKLILESFKQLVNTNRLQFTACSLFNLSYSMILGTILNVITYGIILIQLFLSN